METKEYFEKVMQDFNQNRKGRSLRKYCSDEGVDYKWQSEYKRQYPSTSVHAKESEVPSMTPLTVVDECFSVSSHFRPYFMLRLKNIPLPQI